MPACLLRRVLPVLIALGFYSTPSMAANKPKVPDDFEVRLVATVPAVLYPCQVATAPGGLLFVAEDPMDQVGPYESRDGRILRFKDDKNPVEFAKDFRAIQGMAWRDGDLYVCHMPFLTVIKDTDGDGKADTRKDLFKDLGPTNNQGLNDHIVSGLQFGIDGYLYISVGDKGIPKATGPDGRTIQIKGGGCVRCRPDGTGIEVVSTGTRNHLEINLDERDNMFTYDNTDDGLGWWTRVTHHIDGGYYGYAYDYHTRPDRFLNRMAEYGGGSPCGAVFYKEDAWPEKWRGLGYWAEWGKGKVQAIRFKPNGASYEVAEMIDFAVPDGVDNFRPIDLAISDDGRTMYVADWGMGGWGSKTEKVGRVWAITPKDKVETKPRGKDSDSIEDQIKALAHPAHAERMRAQAALVKDGRDALGHMTAALADAKGEPTAQVHLLWAMDAIAGGTPEATIPILAALSSESPIVREQAARALGERSAPISVERVLELLDDPTPTVRLQALIALGRIRDPNACLGVASFVADSDPYIAFAARIALRRIDDWNIAARAIAKSTDPKVRIGILSAMDEQYRPAAVDVLIAYAVRPEAPTDERAAAIKYLSSIHKKAQPWDGSWWGTRPAAGPPPAKTIAWESTPTIVETIHRSLANNETAIRLAGIAAVKEMNDVEALPILREWFTKEPDDEARKQIALAFGDLKDKTALPILAEALKDAKSPESVREAALTAVETIGTEAGANTLVNLLKEDKIAADRQPRLLAALGKFHVLSSLPAIGDKLGSADPKVRAAAAEAVGKFRAVSEVLPKLRPMTKDSDLNARKAAITALGLVKDRESLSALIALAEKDDTRFEAMTALANIPDLSALQVYLRGVVDQNGDLRNQSASAIAAIRDKAAPVLEELSKRHELSPAAVPELMKVYNAVAPIRRWRVVGPLPIDNKPPFPVDAVDLNASLHGTDGKPLTWRSARAIDAKGQVNFGEVFKTNSDDLAAFAYAEVSSKAARKSQFVVGSDDTLTVWINGKVAYDFQDRRGFEPEQDRFEADLVEGTNRILIKCGNRGGGWQYAVAITSPSEYAFLKAPASAAFDPEAYRQFALGKAGSVEKGRAMFLDPKGLACVKCHALKGEGGAVGPDLSDLGVKYPKAEIIESVLFPSAKIFSGYEPIAVALSDGRVLNGILKAETPEVLEIVDADAKTIKILKEDIDEKKISNVSLMPNGLAEGLSKEDFADLISFLETLRDKPPAKP